MVRVYNYTIVTSIVCYLTFVLFLFADAGKEHAGISNGRLRVRQWSSWVLLLYFAPDWFGSAARSYVGEAVEDCLFA